MARILVLGADGMVGHIARIYFAERGHEVVSIARSETPEWDKLDVEDEGALIAYIDRKRPEIVVNCVGVLIKESREFPERAIRINALLPHILSRLGLVLGFRLIHISSDCVFSGTAGPYREGDRRDADEIYGRTKALGEIENVRDLTIRTSKIGPELHSYGSGLFNWFMGQRGRIKGFSRVMWGGVTTLEMAKAIEAAIGSGASGLVHLSNGLPISKFDLLSLFKEIWGKKDIEIENDDSRSSDRSLICSRSDFSHYVPGYRAMLQEMKNFMLTHMNLYMHYEKE